MKVSLSDSFKYSKLKMSYNEYAEINKGFMKFIMNKVLEGEQIELPVRMGILMVVGRKVTPKIDENGNIGNLAPDWVKTKKLWDSNPQAKEAKTLVYHMNEHTNGVRYKIIWDKSMSGAMNKILYIFKPSRENKRKTWKSILAGKEFYVKPSRNNNHVN